MFKIIATLLVGGFLGYKYKQHEKEIEVEYKIGEKLHVLKGNAEKVYKEVLKLKAEYEKMQKEKEEKENNTNK